MKQPAYKLQVRYAKSLHKAFTTARDTRYRKPPAPVDRFPEGSVARQIAAAVFSQPCGFAAPEAAFDTLAQLAVNTIVALEGTKGAINLGPGAPGQPPGDIGPHLRLLQAFLDLTRSLRAPGLPEEPDQARPDFAAFADAWRQAYPTPTGKDTRRSLAPGPSDADPGGHTVADIDQDQNQDQDHDPLVSAVTELMLMREYAMIEPGLLDRNPEDSAATILASMLLGTAVPAPGGHPHPVAHGLDRLVACAVQTVYTRELKPLPTAALGRKAHAEIRPYLKLHLVMDYFVRLVGYPGDNDRQVSNAARLLIEAWTHVAVGVEGGYEVDNPRPIPFLEDDVN